MAVEPRPGAVPFQEAIDFLRNKLRLTSRAWTDVWQEQHAVAFTVAGAQSAELVADFHTAITRAIAEGTTLQEFRQQFDAIVARHGWSYKGSRGWRTRVIFETNLRTAYQAGRWQQAWDLREARPYLRYVAVMDNRTRPQHRLWHGTVLPITHEWWQTHYPPNGWGCRCTAQSLSERDLQRRGFTVTDPAPPSGGVPRRVETPDGYRIEVVPPGIDPGWSYNVGQASLAAQAAQQALRQVGAMPAEIGAAAYASFGDAVRRAVAEDYRAWARDFLGRAEVVGERTRYREDGSWRALGAFSEEVVAALAARGQPLSSAGIGITSQGLAHILRESKARAETTAGLPRALAVADVLALPEAVARPIAVLRQRDNGAILLVFEPTDPADRRDAKLVVRVDRVEKVDRQVRRLNAAHSGGVVERRVLADPNTYDLLDGRLE